MNISHERLREECINEMDTMIVEKNSWYLVTKSSDNFTLGVGNIFKVYDQGFLHVMGKGTLLPEEASEALKGVEFMNVKDIDIDALLYVLGFNTECV